jgi:hypothetical protein
MKKDNICLCIILNIVLISCAGDTTNFSSINHEPCEEINLNELVTLLGKNINQLPSKNCYFQKDTILEGDEGVKWKGRAFYFKSKELSFVAETNWQDTNNIHRVTIVGSTIKERDIYVGQSFGKIKNLVKEKLSNSPDGYLFLQYKYNPKVFIEIDISNEPSNSPLYYGNVEVKNIPDNLIIVSIVIR